MVPGAAEPETVPDDVRQILDLRNSQFGLSAISLWEVGKKNQIGKLPLKKGSQRMAKGGCGFTNYRAAPDPGNYRRCHEPARFS